MGAPEGDACRWEASGKRLRFYRGGRRRGESQDEGFDLIAGGVADDQVYRAVDLYYKGLWTLDRTIEELSFYDRNDQYCFKSQPFLDRTLVFEEAYEVTQ